MTLVLGVVHGRNIFMNTSIANISSTSQTSFSFSDQIRVASYVFGSFLFCCYGVGGIACGCIVKV